MTARTARWDLVGRGSDPVPASEADVRVVADDMSDRATAASDMHDKLSRLADLDGWRGKAAEAFADKADDVLGDLGKVEERYSKVAKALSTWSTAVGTAQIATWNAVQDAETADESMRKHPEHHGATPPTPEEKNDDDAHQAAKGDLDAARTAVDNAMDALDDAAGTAEGDIDDAADVWDDGFWGNVGGWVRSHADFIDIVCKVLEVIAAVVAVVILVCAIVATAPFALLVAAALIGGALLLGHSALVLSDSGKATWTDVGFDILNLATLGFGGGLASAATKGMTRLVATVAPRVGSATRAAALSRLAGGSMTQLRNAVRIRNPANNLARWANGLVHTATTEGDSAAAAVRALEHLNPTRLSTLIHQDEGLARLTQQISSMRGLVSGGDELAALARIRNQAIAAITANTTGNIVSLGKDVPGVPEGIQDIIDFAQHPQWTTRPG